MIDPTVAIRQASSVAVVDSGERLVLLDLDDLRHPEPVALEGSARAVWLAIGAGSTIREVATTLAATHGDVNVVDVERDVASFVSVMLARRLLVSDGCASSRGAAAAVT